MKNKFSLPVVFTVIFLLPEFIWSPILNIILGLESNYVFRKTSLYSFPSAVVLSIFVLQFVGIVGLLAALIKTKSLWQGKKRIVWVLFLLIALVLTLMSAFAIFLYFLSRNITLL